MRGFSEDIPPRPGTRRRAVFDELLGNAAEGRTTTWAQAKQAYDDHPPAYDHREFGPRSHSDMEVGKILKHYATRVARGLYALKDEWKDRPFAEGDRVRYIGGYGHFDAAGVPKGAIFEVAGWGDLALGEGKPRFLYLKNGTNGRYLSGYPRAAAGGHGAEHFERVIPKEAEPPAAEEFRLPAWKHKGPQPKMTDVCGTCGKRYGEHYGANWPEPSDCPTTDAGGYLRREDDPPKRRYWNPAPATTGRGPDRAVPRKCGEEGCGCGAKPVQSAPEFGDPPAGLHPDYAPIRKADIRTQAARVSTEASAIGSALNAPLIHSSERLMDIRDRLMNIQRDLLALIE